MIPLAASPPHRFGIATRTTLCTIGRTPRGGIADLLRLPRAFAGERPRRAARIMHGETYRIHQIDLRRAPAPGAPDGVRRYRANDHNDTDAPRTARAERDTDPGPATRRRGDDRRRGRSAADQSGGRAREPPRHTLPPGRRGTFRLRRRREGAAVARGEGAGARARHPSPSSKKFQVASPSSDRASRRYTARLPSGPTVRTTAVPAGTLAALGLCHRLEIERAVLLEGTRGRGRWPRSSRPRPPSSFGSASVIDREAMPLEVRDRLD